MTEDQSRCALWACLKQHVVEGSCLNVAVYVCAQYRLKIINSGNSGLVFSVVFYLCFFF